MRTLESPIILRLDLDQLHAEAVHVMMSSEESGGQLCYLAGHVFGAEDGALQLATWLTRVLLDNRLLARR